MNNANSSRFGKFLKIHYDANGGGIVAATTEVAIAITASPETRATMCSRAFSLPWHCLSCLDISLGESTGHGTSRSGAKFPHLLSALVRCSAPFLLATKRAALTDAFGLSAPQRGRKRC